MFICGVEEHRFAGSFASHNEYVVVDWPNDNTVNAYVSRFEMRNVANRLHSFTVSALAGRVPAIVRRVLRSLACNYSSIGG